MLTNHTTYYTHF